MNEDPAKTTQPSPSDAPKNDALKVGGQSLDDLSLAPESPEEINPTKMPEAGLSSLPESPVPVASAPAAEAPKPLQTGADFSAPIPDAPLVTDEPVKPAVPPVPAVAKSKKWLKLIVASLILLLVLAAIAYGAYRWGNSRGYTNGKKAGENAMNMAAKVSVPSNATMISQCTEGEGTQYVVPSNIPQGPIYNVWKNKVTGLEYMLAASDIAKGKTDDLAMMNQKYDHIDVMYEAAGHAGFTEPHYHIILSFLSYADEQKIKCGSSSSSGMSDMSM